MTKGLSNEVRMIIFYVSFHYLHYRSLPVHYDHAPAYAPDFICFATRAADFFGVQPNLGQICTIC